jgi:DNA-binding response OmpR family regulator
MRILLIEDDQEIAGRLTGGLIASGFVVDHAPDGADGFAMGELEDYSAVVLDLGLPRMQGIDILRRWRAKGRKFPVLVLTARGTWAEKVDGLNAGADDYITKPFHIAEVAARLRALIRRSSGIANPVLEHRGIALDPVSCLVTHNSKPVELTGREFRMLNYFLHRIGRLVPQRELLENLYSTDEECESNTIEVYVSRLRRKLGHDVIKTVRGLGYRME